MKPLNQPNGTNTAIDPMCGKRLEPKTVTGGTDDEEYAELRNMTRRFRVGAVLTLLDFSVAEDTVGRGGAGKPPDGGRWSFARMRI